MSTDIGDKIQGVWNIEYMDVGSDPNARTKVPKAFMFMLTKRHYTAIRDFAEPDASAKEDAAAPADRLFMADAGTMNSMAPTWSFITWWQSFRCSAR